MPKLADRVAETTTTTGTGTVTLGGAKTGYRTFASVSTFADADLVYYAIFGTTEWETGVGTLGSGKTTLARTVVLASSNSGSAVSFSSGSKDVICTAAAASLAPLGPYSTAAATESAYPAASNSGRLALVGSSAPYDVYFSDGSAWVYAGGRSEPLVTIAASGSSFTQSAVNTSVIDCTLTGNCTVAFSSVPAGAYRVRLVLRQGSGGPWSVTWPSNTTWNTGTAPTLATATGAADLIELMTVDGGTNWLGVALVTGAGASIKLRDETTRADSSSTVGTADTGQSWSALTSTFGISSNKIYRVGTASTDSILSVDVGEAWSTYQVTVLSTTEFPGVAFDITDSNNFFVVLVNNASGSLEFFKRVSGTYTSLTTSATGLFSSGASIVIKVVRTGANKTIYLNGTSVITSTDTSHSATQKVGMRFQTGAGTNNARWSDITVT